MGTSTNYSSRRQSLMRNANVCPLLGGTVKDQQNDLKLDLKKLKDKFEKLIVCKNGQFPELLNFVFQGEIAYDSLVILDHYIKLMEPWNTKIEDDFIWSDFYKKFHKYKPFFLHYAPLSDIFYRKAIINGLTLQK